MVNVRIRGKIRREEWPKIAERFQKGETLTEIARSYGCTAPAIRYIVRRTLTRSGKGGRVDRDKVEKVAVLTLPADGRRNIGAARSDDRRRSSREMDGRATETWGRINTDIATFLAAIDRVAADDSDASYEALLAASDRLLWASARTKLEVERVLDERRKGSSVRRFSA